MERKKGGKEVERRRRGSERERGMRRLWERERDRWGSEWVRDRGRLLKREREKDRRREYDNWEERKSPGKTDVPKLYAYIEYEHSVFLLSIMSILSALLWYGDELKQFMLKFINCRARLPANTIHQFGLVSTWGHGTQGQRNFVKREQFFGRQGIWN